MSEKPTKLHVEADEQHLLLEHSYDGIQELNHPLPSWWNVMFYLGIVFAIGYTIYYEALGGKSLRQEFTEHYTKVREVQEEYKKLHGPFDPNQYAAYTTPDNLKAGEAVYVENCMQCHMEGGKGDIGPNLSDKHWLLAKGTPDTIYQVVYTGSEENGMPAWGEILSSEDMYRVVGYVMTFKNTFHKEGKEPQGELIDD
ncbi:MAG: cbb3-type cytochrome c oxidase N-terminal domain-containing protein [Bacteriovoracia bacterium]